MKSDVKCTRSGTTAKLLGMMDLTARIRHNIYISDHIRGSLRFLNCTHLYIKNTLVTVACFKKNAIILSLQKWFPTLAHTLPSISMLLNWLCTQNNDY